MSGNGGNGKGNGNGGAGAGDLGLFTFPCRFEIKAMGACSVRFEAVVQAIVSRHIGPRDLLRTRARVSRNGRYVSLTCIIRAQSRTQLDTIYRELSACPDVLMTL